MQYSKILCALDTGDLDVALTTIRRLSPFVGGFKIGHALALPHGLDVLERLRGAGAERIFLDLKFHDIPNSVALAVREAAKRGVWMLTVHTSGGSVMMRAAADAAKLSVESAPLVVGVTVLTSIEPSQLQSELGVRRQLSEQAVHLSELAARCGLDGVVCSPHEITSVREAIGSSGLIVSPGIRAAEGQTHDQVRTGSARQAITDGADYLVIGRALSESADVEETLASMGFDPVTRVT